MKKYNIFFLIAFPVVIPFHILHASVQESLQPAIFFDVKTVLHTNSMLASGYVGKMDSLHYVATTGHLPSQERLFEQLSPIPAQCTQCTYNQNLTMPLILSDWLTNAQPASKIKEVIEQYLQQTPIKDIEKKVLKSIVNMMLTPKSLADTQQENHKIIDLLHQLRSHHIATFLTGNWSDLSSLRSEFSEVFALFDGVFFSGDLQLLKPYQAFYNKVLEYTKVKTSQAFWVEQEPMFITKAQEYGLQIVSCDVHHIEQLREHLFRLCKIK